MAVLSVSVLHHRPVLLGILEDARVVHEVLPVGAALHAQGAAGDPAVGIGSVAGGAGVGRVEGHQAGGRGGCCRPRPGCRGVAAFGRRRFGGGRACGLIWQGDRSFGSRGQGQLSRGDCLGQYVGRRCAAAVAGPARRGDAVGR